MPVTMRPHNQRRFFCINKPTDLEELNVSVKIGYDIKNGNFLIVALFNNLMIPDHMTMSN